MACCACFMRWGSEGRGRRGQGRNHPWVPGKCLVQDRVAVLAPVSAQVMVSAQAPVTVMVSATAMALVMVWGGGWQVRGRERRALRVVPRGGSRATRRAAEFLREYRCSFLDSWNLVAVLCCDARNVPADVESAKRDDAGDEDLPGGLLKLPPLFDADAQGLEDVP